jgi:hypothetical protein
VAFILKVYVIDAGDKTIKVGHEFYGLTEAEVDTYYREHVGSCEYFKAAVAENRVIEELEEVDDDELPDAADLEMEEEDEG